MTMKPSWARRLTATLAALAAAGAGTLATVVPMQPAVAAPVADATPTAADVDASLNATAELLARAIGNVDLRKQFKEQIKDPGEGTAYATLAKVTDIRAHLAAAYRSKTGASETASLAAVDAYVSGIPRFEVDVPVNFDKWDVFTTTAPLVAYVPQGVDDADLKTFPAFDSSGRSHELDANAVPGEPVVVLGPDEAPTEQEIADGDIDLGEPEEASADIVANSCNWVRLYQAELVHDHEPALKGAAEIAFIAKTVGVNTIKKHSNIDELNHDGDFWTHAADQGLPMSQSCTAKPVSFYWYENDSGNVDVTVTVKGVSLGVKIAAEDDFVGSEQVPNYTFVGTTNEVQDLLDLVQTTN